MTTFFQQRIGVKLFVLLTALIVLVMTPFCYVVFSTFAQFGSYTVGANRDEAKVRATSYLSTIAREKAHKYDAVFSQAETSTSLMAVQAREVFDRIDHYSKLPVGQRTSAEQTLSASTGYHEHTVATVFRLYRNMTAEDMRELLAMMQLDPFLKGLQENIRGSVSTHLITAAGVCRYLRNSLQVADGATLHGSNPLHYSAIEETLGEMYGASLKNRVSTVWTRVYPDAVTGSPLITVLSPVYDSQGVMRATVGVDISLAGTVELLEGGDPGHVRNWDGATLFSFLLGEKGEMINFPKEHLALFGFPRSSKVDKVSPRDLHLKLEDSHQPSVLSLADMLLGPVEGTAEVELGGDTYVLNMHTLHRLNWHLVLVTSEARLSSSAERTEQALSGTILLLVKKFILHGVLILVVTLIVVYFAVDYFVGPLKRLSETAVLVGRGDLQWRCEVNREDEVGILARSFNSMVQQLELAEKRKEEQARQLEQTVKERTRDLRNKNIVLRNVIEELNAESDRRREAVEALKKSEEQIRKVMDASVAGHGIIQAQRIRYVNSMASRIFGYSRDEMIGGAFGVADLVAPGQYERVRRMSTEHFRASDNRPFLIKCRRRDGSIFEALVGGAVTTWDGKEAVVATIMDISDQQQTEEKLFQSKRLLHESLAEKEVLLREIYHRTKNNMLVIISMLQLQAMELGDERVKKLFMEMENRIRAMSLVHEKLYQSQNLTEIDLGLYLEEMVTALVRNMVIGNTVTVEMNCQQVPVSIDNGIPVGLAVNEIVTNSLKHAFPGGKKGCISVSLTQDSTGLVEVVVADDGQGLPPGLKPENARSLGMQITNSLITRQLRGTVQVTNEGGLVYRIRFSEPLRPKRV